MIGRKTQHREKSDDTARQGFDDFTLKLGDVMRGERATMGKSLLDVQRELRIKASYIAAIENCDPSAFDTPGFIAGYVRSYARYLGMDPDEAFAHFCAESGFSVAHGMSQQASVIRKARNDDQPRPRTRDSLAEPRMPFAPARDSLLSRVEPGALGSTLVLIALLGGIGYGGYLVLQEVQRVQVTPVDQTPIVLSELDPLQAAMAPSVSEDDPIAQAGVFTPPTTEAFDRLYRPQALDVPVLVARDAPISSLDPDSVGVFARNGSGRLPDVQDSSLAAAALEQRLIAEGVLPPDTAPQKQDGLPVLTTSKGVTVVAARPAWVEVRSETGGVLLSRVLNAGETFAVPGSAVNPRIRVGESGAVYFNVDGQTYGPSGAPGRVTTNISLAAADVVDKFDPVDPAGDKDLIAALTTLGLAAPQTRVARADPAAPVAPAALAQQLRDSVPMGPSRPLTLADLTPTETAPSAPTVTPVARPDTLAAVPPEPAAVPGVPRVTAAPQPGITVVATAETWVEVTSPSGQKLFARTLQAGESYAVPQTDQPPTIFSGNAGGVFFAVNGQTYGPYGENGQFGRDLALDAGEIQSKMQVADLSRNQALAKVVAELQLQDQ